MRSSKTAAALAETGVDRTKLNFSQAEGLAPLPTPLKLGEMSDELRALLWNEIYNSVSKHTHYPTMGARRR
ncbi:MAG: hypothetical protein OEQ29_24115 [Alphaproteobacteria bacterium]|nr:hypothetical protein [Alphaproteobacteria bacterium]